MSQRENQKRTRPVCFRKVVRTNRWHSVEVRVGSVHEVDMGDDGFSRELRIAADQEQRWNDTYLTPKAARELARLLLRAAEAVESSRV